jgi:hypothetical protein
MLQRCWQPLQASIGGSLYTIGTSLLLLLNFGYNTRTDQEASYHHLAEFASVTVSGNAE